MNIERMVEEIQSKYGIIGREKEIKKALLAVMASKHLLIEGAVGVGKTVLATAIASYLNREIFRVDGDERYTEQKLTGWFDPPLALKKGYVRETFIPGPLTEAMNKGGILFINELNRMPEGVQNVLLPAMDEGQIEIPYIGTIKAEAGFLIIATQNPLEFVGTGNISEALKDRFEHIPLSFQNEREELEIVKLRSNIKNEEILKIAVKIVRATRVHPAIKRGASIRAALSIASLMNILNSNSKENVRDIAYMALPTRIQIREESGKNVYQVIDEILEKVFFDEDLFRSGKLEEKKEEEGKKSLPTSSSSYGNQDLVNKIKHIINLIETFNQDEELGIIIARNFPFLMLKLNEQELHFAKNLATKAIIEKILKSLGHARMPIERKKLDYFPGLKGELDLEDTFEKIMVKESLEAKDISIQVKEPKRLGCSMMLDASLSMAGDKLALASASLAVLALKLKFFDFSVVIFKDNARVIKAMDEIMSVERLIGKILEIPASGYTNIYDGLDKGLIELNKFPYKEKLSVIITDGYYTVGPNPIPMASKHPNLFVIMVNSEQSNANEKVCSDMAKVGHGQLFSIMNIEEIPIILYNALRDISSRLS
ncbi:MAG: AAA family ATPase [Nitrososphaerales archaeon]